MSPKKKEILWNLVNSCLAGGLVLLGSLANGDLTMKGITAALIAAGIVVVTKFKHYWDLEEKEYSTNRVFNFL